VNLYGDLKHERRQTSRLSGCGKAGGYGDLFMTAGSKEELKFFIKGLRRALKEPILNEEDL